MPILTQFATKLQTIYPDFELNVQRTLFINEAYHVGVLVHTKTGYNRILFKLNFRNIKDKEGAIKVTLKFVAGGIGRKDFTEANDFTNFLESIVTDTKLKTLIKEIREAKLIYRITEKNGKTHLSFNDEINKPSKVVSHEMVTFDEIKDFIYDLLESKNNLDAVKIFESLLDYFALLKNDAEKISILFNLAISLGK